MELNLSHNLFEVEKSEQMCEKHQRRLVKCFIKNCTGCIFMDLCHNSEFCSECACNIMSARDNHRQKMWFNEFQPKAKELHKVNLIYKKLKGEFFKSQNEKSRAEMERAEDDYMVLKDEVAKIKVRLEGSI